ncbi:MAG TPA: TIGR02266 family protein [Polyangia bacterium]|jgi:uncharacterized protein (TIGR02266 family)
MDVPDREHEPRRGPVRRTGRAELEVPVSFRSRGAWGTGTTKNLSSGGLFVATFRALPVGTRVVVRLTFPGDREALEALGEVRWVRDFRDLDDRPAGLGLRFIDTPVRAALRARPPRVVGTT